MFNGVNLASWNQEIFLQSLDIELQYIINKGLYQAILDEELGNYRQKKRNEISVLDRTKLTLDEELRNVRPKKRNKISILHRTNLTLDAKAMNVSYNAQMPMNQQG